MYEVLDRALLHAAQLHSGQFREGENPLPYLTHVVEVLSNVRFIGDVTDENMLAAAALHDALEETSENAEHLAELFGLKVRQYVDELTRREPSKAETKGMDPDQIWELRSSILLEEIEKMSQEAQTIKLADRLANLRDAKRTKSAKKRMRYVAQTAEILNIVPRTVNEALWDTLWDELPNSD